MKNCYCYDFSVGKLYIAEENGGICDISFSEIGGNPFESDLIKECKKQLDEYFCGKRKEFKLPLNFNGTEFQKKVWNALLTIPYGKTASYKEIAQKIGSEKACRAVGMANNKNKIAIVIPCHRVIGSGGDLTGYAGGLEFKRKLLDLEKQYIYERKN